MITFIKAAGDLSMLALPPNYEFPALRGDRAGSYAMNVTANYRLTFRLTEEAEVADLNLEDYHGR